MVDQSIADTFPEGCPIKTHDIEVKNGVSIPTYFMMVELERRYPDCQFHFILGTDLVPTLYQWDEGEKFIRDMSFIIFERSGYEHLFDKPKTKGKNHQSTKLPK